MSFAYEYFIIFTSFPVVFYRQRIPEESLGFWGSFGAEELQQCVECFKGTFINSYLMLSMFCTFSVLLCYSLVGFLSLFNIYLWNKLVTSLIFSCVYFSCSIIIATLLKLGCVFDGENVLYSTSA